VIRSLVKLALVVLIANAAWRVGNAYLSHYRFTDAVQQLVHYRGDKTDAEIHDRVFNLATQYDIGVTDETLTIQREENRTIVDGAYTKPIEFFPRMIYEWPFTIHIDTPIVDPLKLTLPTR
jgi:sporulation-control protein spo0M